MYFCDFATGRLPPQNSCLAPSNFSLCSVTVAMGLGAQIQLDFLAFIRQQSARDGSPSLPKETPTYDR